MDIKDFKILSLGLDAKALDKDSILGPRLVKYGEMVAKYTVITAAPEDGEVDLSNKVKVFGVGGFKPLALWKMYRQAGCLLKKEDYTIITVQDIYYVAFLGLFLSRKFKKGLEIQIHGFERFSGLRARVARFVLPRARAIRTVSLRLKDRLVNEFGVKAPRVTVVPMAVRLKRDIERLYVDKDNLIFLTIGRLVEVKNIELQIRAMADAVSEYPGPELWIAGEGPLRESLESLVGGLNLKNNIKFLGWVSDLAAMYEKADVFMLTSFAEGWPMVVGEAAAMKLPIIMTDMGSAGEFIVDNESGLVIPQNDKDALVSAMKKMIEDNDLRQRLGIGAYDAFKALPGEDKILEKYKESWRKAAETIGN